MITIWNFDISCLKTMTRIKTISQHDQKTSVVECQHHQASNIIHWVIIAATNLQCTILHKLYYLRCRDFLKIVTGHLDTKHNWSKKWAQTTGTTKKATSCSVLRIFVGPVVWVHFLLQLCFVSKCPVTILRKSRHLK